MTNLANAGLIRFLFHVDVTKWSSNSFDSRQITAENLTKQRFIVEQMLFL